MSMEDLPIYKEVMTMIAQDEKDRAELKDFLAPYIKALGIENIKKIIVKNKERNEKPWTYYKQQERNKK